MKRLSAYIAAILTTLSAAAAGPSVLTVNTTITDSAMVFPEALQANVHKLRENWYLRYNTEFTDPVAQPTQPTDEEVIARLQRIPTTIPMSYNPVVRKYIDKYTVGSRSLVNTMLGLGLYYNPIFEEALDREGLPLELKYLPVIESALNPDAVSRSGATGLWQFMLETGKGLGMEINTLVDERRDPLVASAMAAKYLKKLYGIFGDWGLAIAAYNCGPGNVSRALARAGSTADNPLNYWQIYNYLPAETRGYVPGFIGATYALNYYAEHGIKAPLARKPVLTDTVHVKERIYFAPLAEALQIPVTELRVLNPQYRQEIIPGDVKPYALRLPSQMVYTYLMLEDSIISASAALRPATEVSIETPVVAAASTEQQFTEEVKYHKVRRGQTLTQIARIYGVSVADLKSWNKLRSNKPARGTRIKIVVRKPVPVAVPEPPAAVDMAEQTDREDLATDEANEADESTLDSEVMNAAPAKEVKEEVVVAEKPAPAKKPEQKTPKKPTATRHKVKAGDTLYQLAKKYGVSVKDIQQANSLSSTSLSIGQTLKIPKP